MHENKRVQNFIKSIHERCKDLSEKSTDEKMEIINNGIEEIKDFKEELKDDQFFFRRRKNHHHIIVRSVIYRSYSNKKASYPKPKFKSYSSKREKLDGGYLWHP